MLNNFFNNIFSYTSETISLQGVLSTFIVALVLGFIIAITYYKTQGKTGYQRNFVITLIMLPVILSVIVLFIGNNIARAFSLSGTLAIVRYRSAPGDPKDIGFVFFATAAGLSCGVGLYGYGLIFVILLCAVLFIIEKIKFATPSKSKKLLKVTVPENLNFQDEFNNILSEYTVSFEQVKIKTTELGSLFEVVYNITVDIEFNQLEMINKIRCVNGNLSIILNDLPYTGVNL